MNAYDFIQSFAEAIRDNEGIKDYAIANFGKGLLIQIDTDMESLIGSNEAPYLLIKSVPGGDDSNVSDQSLAAILLEVGATPSGEPPYFSDTTDRSDTANGLRVYGQGNLVVDLLQMCIDVIKALAIEADEQVISSTVDAEGSLYFPLQVAQSTLNITQTNDLGSL